MFTLLFEAVKLQLQHLLHCFVYALPAQATLALLLYLFKQDTPVIFEFLCGLVFLVLNTMYVHAATQQMMKRRPGVVDIAGALRWQSGHLDFFFFVAMGMFILCLMLLFFIDAVNLMFAYLAHLEEMQSAAVRSGYEMKASSYTILALGSEVAAFVMLVVGLLVWMSVCRSGIRIPAYVEGYYLRREEALQLTRADGIAPLVCSFMCIIGVTAYTNMLSDYVPDAALHWTLPLLWAGGYFLIVTSHLAMWVRMYIVQVKMPGYHMSRVQI